MPPWLMSLAARDRPGFGDRRQQLEIAAQPRMRRVGRGLPVGERLAVAAAQVDRGDQPVAGLGVEAGQQPPGAAEDRDRQLAAIGADVGVTADDRHAKGLRCGLQPGEHRRRIGFASAQIASTTAIGRPPIAATSEILTITPHQPANQGSPATNSFMKPSMANSR